jgi:hypothetical protein
MQAIPDTVSTNFSIVNAGVAAGSDAVITINSSAEDWWQIGLISGGYAGAPAVGSLLNVKFEGVLVWQIPIIEAGAFHYLFPEKGPGSLISNKNESVTITLTDGRRWKYLSIGYR